MRSPSYARAEPAPVAERQPGRGDGVRERPLREDLGVGAVTVRVSRRCGVTAGLRRPPREVAALDDPVQLVVALRPVLALPEALGVRIEREAERVAVAEGPHERAEGVRRGHRAVGVHAQDLAPRFVGEVLCGGRVLPTVPDHDVERAVGPERDAASVVVRA